MDIISNHDWPDDRMIPDGYDMKTVPDFTPRNFLYLVDKVNELIGEVNQLKAEQLHVE